MENRTILLTIGMLAIPVAVWFLKETSQNFREFLIELHEKLFVPIMGRISKNLVSLAGRGEPRSEIYGHVLSLKGCVN